MSANFGTTRRTFRQIPDGPTPAPRSAIPETARTRLVLIVSSNRDWLLSNYARAAAGWFR